MKRKNASKTETVLSINSKLKFSTKLVLNSLTVWIKLDECRKFSMLTEQHAIKIVIKGMRTMTLPRLRKKPRRAMTVVKIAMMILNEA